MSYALVGLCSYSIFIFFNFSFFSFNYILAVIILHMFAFFQKNLILIHSGFIS